MNGFEQIGRRFERAVKKVIHPKLSKEDSLRVNDHPKKQEQNLSKEVYQEHVLQSQYIEVRDGTKLAADIYIPAINGKVVDDTFPCIWSHQRYHRRQNFVVFEFNMGFFNSPWAKELIKAGYVVVVVDVRGGGASFGTKKTLLDDLETQDAYDITEWIAEQDWCDGSVGMFGHSYVGTNQLMAVSEKPKHLKAISPEVPFFDLYRFVYPNGVFRYSFTRFWTGLVDILDKTAPAVGVDGDLDRELAKEAKKDHTMNRELFNIVKDSPYRDSKDPDFGGNMYEIGPYTVLKQIKSAKIPAYFMAGWLDIFTIQTLLAYENWEGPKKLTIGPWCHMEQFSGGFERHKWYDYWLKGRDTGIMEEYPVLYYTMGVGDKSGWKGAESWPIPNTESRSFYLGDGSSGTINSVNDGRLYTHKPEESQAMDEYTVNYNCSSGISSRWKLLGVYSDMRRNDKRGLTYTGEPLDKSLTVTGHPIVEIWVQSPNPDLVLFVYLETVCEDGSSHYITEGVMRASHRACNRAPYRNFDLPFHRGNLKDINHLRPNNPVKLRFDMLPTSYYIDKGCRIRVTITGADKDNYFVEKRDPANRFSVLRDNKHPSKIILPFEMKGKGYSL